MDVSLFGYKTGNSLLHKMPAGLKLAILFAFSFFMFFSVNFLQPLEQFLPPQLRLLPTLALPLGLLVPLFLLSPAPRDTLKDTLPVVNYGLFLCLINFLLFLGGVSGANLPDIAPLLARIIPIAAAASLVYRTTSPLQIRGVFETAEIRLRTFLRLKNKQASIAEMLALYFMFMPRIFENWKKAELAWQARGGKNGPAKLARLLPVLFTLSLHDAWQTARALLIRKK